MASGNMRLVTNTAGFIECKLSHMPGAAYNADMAKLGFLGLGIMGYPMARNLLRGGHEVALWSHSAAKARELAAADKGRFCATPKEVAEAADKGRFCATPKEVAENADAIF